MQKMLIVDDEINIRNLIRKYAQADGYSVTEAGNGLDALDCVLNEEFDIIILDLMMPEMNGFDACKMIRKESDTPIIMLTARDSEFDKYQGFELGIDDYVVKPFSPKELMYRVEAIRKRVQANHVKTYKFEGISVDYQARRVEVEGHQVDLSPKEYDLFTYFISNRGIALQRDQILNKVWGYDFFGDDRTLDTHVKRLRKKLNPYNDLIVTIRGVGYRYEG